MYRDDPLDDEMELRAIVGDEEIDTLIAVVNPEVHERPPLHTALDVLRLLQGWADDAAIAAWFTRPQRRLDGDTPIAALARGANDEVEDAARAWAAAQG